MRLITPLLLALLSFGFGGGARAQAVGEPPADQSSLGEFVVTGTKVEHVTKLAVLPSLNPDLEDVTVRSTVRRDLELSGMFEVIADRRAPDGMYSFTDPVDIEAWKKVGAEVIVKVAARRVAKQRLEVLGLAYFVDTGAEPVFEKRFTCALDEVRPMAHRVTDALLGAITGRPGGFFSHFAFTSKKLTGRHVYVMDSDGWGLTQVFSPGANIRKPMAISPAFGPREQLFFAYSENYAPFALRAAEAGRVQPIFSPFSTSVYGIDFDSERLRVALAVAEGGRSYIYLGSRGGSEWKKVSTTELATAPAFSPSGKIAWIGGGATQGTQRVFVDGKAVSPPGFTAASPTFCDTEDGIRLVYAVAVGNDRLDLVMSDEQGRGIVRLTQGQGSNFAPACSPDGRVLAFFSSRGKTTGLYMMSLKRFVTQKVNDQIGDSLVWERLPEGTIKPEKT
jgi:TolB protein